MPNNIYPLPLSIQYTGKEFLFESEITISVSKEFNMHDSFMILQELWKNFTFGIGKLNFETDENLSGYTIKQGLIEMPFSEENEYVLSVSTDGFAICAQSSVGLLHGFYTFIQMIKPKRLKENEELFGVDCVRITDRPCLSFRCLHLSVGMDTTLHNLRTYIRLAALLKFSHIIIEFFGSLRFDCLGELAWPGAYGKEEIRPILEEAKNMGLEIIPLFNHLGHAGLGDLMNCKHVVLEQNPKLALLFEPEGWSYCISNPETIKLLRDVRKELMILCGDGSYFHIGMDEALDFATCDRCSPADKNKLLSDFINDIHDELKGLNRRTMIWADMLLYRETFDPGHQYKVPGKDFFVANSSDKLPTHEIIKHLEKDIIIVDWQYYIKSGELLTTQYLMEQGFDTITASWTNFENVKLLAEGAGKMGAFGYMSTLWGVQKNFADLLLFSAEAAWMGADAKKLDTFRLESRFHAVANLQRKLLQTAVTFETAGWN